MKLPFKEKFLQFVWQYQYFDHNILQLNSGEELKVIHPGYKNANAGPDFIQAKLKIGDILWVGSVEIHVNSSDWESHHHHNDSAYDNVVLHVVYESPNSSFTKRKDGSFVPILQLRKLISDALIAKGNSLFENISPIPCSNCYPSIDEVTLLSTIDRAVISRLERKAQEVVGIFNQSNKDWEETTYKMLAQYFGMKINNDPFLRLASLTPFKLVSKLNGNLFALEALFFGQAGFLKNASDADDRYRIELLQEYNFLKRKFELSDSVDISEWKHLRLRPFNFPEKRISELAALYAKSPSLHASLIEIENLAELRLLLKAEVSGYWQNHIQFNKTIDRNSLSIGDQAVDSLIINVVTVLLAAYGIYRNDTRFLDRALAMLETIKAEDNKVTRAWAKLKVYPKNAYDSQGLIELFNNHCSLKKCLDCPIGVKLIRSTN